MRSDSSRCTIVLPVLNEESIIEKTTSELFAVFLGINMDILFVDDGSADSTWLKITELSRRNLQISGLRFSRNFGKESAMLAGVANARGDCVIVMDADLQHPPAAALEMFNIWKDGDSSIIEGVKIRRQDEGALKKFGAKAFYKILLVLSGIDLDNASDFKLIDRNAADIIMSMPERQTFFRAMSGWTGLKTDKVYFEAPSRAGGVTKFSVLKLAGMAVNSITAYTSLPMQLVTVTGLGFFMFAVIMSFQTLYMKLYGKAAGGFTTVIILLLLIGSILMISLGIIGIYISKIYNEVKFRPRYVLSETIGENPGMGKA
ncbi:MAG: glycosyltransferase family 2 protein [Clostridiales bacterium]|jgi:dolichol-phosphate mannosyltransferase|nr:glycosyltransferase family 2 protein [Clostridiales bacterium]